MLTEGSIAGRSTTREGYVIIGRLIPARNGVLSQASHLPGIVRTAGKAAASADDNILFSVNLTTGQATSLGKFPTGSVITHLTAPATGPLRRRMVVR